MTAWVYNDRRWIRVRRQVLIRDGYTCTLHLPGCKGQATEVDHIIEWSRGGPPFDPANLRATCKSCNVSKRNTHNATHTRRRSSRHW